MSGSENFKVKLNNSDVKQMRKNESKNFAFLLSSVKRNKPNLKKS